MHHIVLFQIVESDCSGGTKSSVIFIDMGRFSEGLTAVIPVFKSTVVLLNDDMLSVLLVIPPTESPSRVIHSFRMWLSPPGTFF